MPASTNPSGLLAESLAALSKSAYQAFAEVENQARHDVAQAMSDSRDARLERDRALEALHAAQLEGQELQKEVASVKAALKQAEISIAHQKETIAQLRREATQWKDQSRNWQEHFLRVEQERCSLTTRIDELVTERLQWSNPLATPVTPNQPAVDIVESTSSPSLKPASSTSLGRPLTYKSGHPPSPPEVDPPSTSISAHKQSRAVNKPVKASRHKDTSPTRPLPAYEAANSNQQTDPRLPRGHKASPRSPTRHKSQSMVIRRVQAVVHVKQEESDGESGSLEPDDGSRYENTTSANPRRPLRRKREVVPDEEEYISGDENEPAPMSSDYEDDEEQVNPDDEDDELMLGAEGNRLDQRNTRAKSSKNAPLSSSPSKKRKLAGPTGREKPPARRKA
ncbi:hypothetical protein LshimejAT787_0502720 [Lyophyllum shimeji]|uniref:Uncharacterized protein n=1 Tax=Lyophyllum shimeji TaxID=47721 RepID=A0A9P3PLA2_LYOSH|nr:hypothetical protein LshimejAT787_0502720 [Lyophyllum shimeji]